MTATWSVNRLAARAVMQRPASERAELLDMLGLLDADGRLLPDDTAVYALAAVDTGAGARNPNSEHPRTAVEVGRKPAGMTTPAGLATLTPISQQPKSKPKKVRERKPPKPPKVAKCGTYGGYSKHRRVPEEACEACKNAAREYRQNYMSKYRGEGREKPRRASQAVCGTTGGYSRHNRAGEKPCRPCTDAKNAYWRVKKAERRKAAGLLPYTPRVWDSVCGTPEGLEKHRRHRKTICDACRAVEPLVEAS